MPTHELNVNKDAHISEANPNTVYGTAGWLFTAVEEETGTFRTLISFDKSLISGSILTAKLILTCINMSGYSQYVRAYPITSDWQESSVTWNTQPSHDSEKLLSEVLVTTVGQTYEWDISSIDWSQPFYGIKLMAFRTQPGTSLMQYASKENSTVENRPKFIITTLGADIAFADENNTLLRSDKYPDESNILDLSQVTAGEQSTIKEIKLYNSSNFQTSNVLVHLENIPSGDSAEISKFNNPFIPSPEVHFDGTFAPGSYIGTFYIRVKPGEDSSGSKSFRIKASAAPV